jgi:hypothetical protein
MVREQDLQGENVGFKKKRGRERTTKQTNKPTNLPFGLVHILCCTNRLVIADVNGNIRVSSRNLHK